MAVNHPNNIDPKPKRRKDKDNPYTLFSVGKDTDNPHYFISFKDVQQIQHCIEISETLYRTFDGFELSDLAHLNEVDNHYMQSERTEESLLCHTAENCSSLEEEALREIQNELLYKAIAELPEVQRRRLTLYYYGGMTYAEIAAKEGCTITPVKNSVDRAIASLKEKIKFF